MIYFLIITVETLSLKLQNKKIEIKDYKDKLTPYSTNRKLKPEFPSWRSG